MVEVAKREGKVEVLHWKRRIRKAHWASANIPIKLLVDTVESKDAPKLKNLQQSLIIKSTFL